MVMSYYPCTGGYLAMTVNTENLVSITEANQNFSKVARMVDEKGAVVILKNIDQNREAYEELAK